MYDTVINVFDYMTGRYENLATEHSAEMQDAIDVILEERKAFIDMYARGVEGYGEVGGSHLYDNSDIVRYSLSPTKRAKLETIILDLDKSNIYKSAGNKKIKILADDYSVNKAIYSKKGRTDREVNARIKAIPEFEKIIKQSEFSHSDTKIVGIDKGAKKNVIAMHYFTTTYNGFDIEILVRDKGKKQFLYEIKFIENKKFPTEYAE